MTYSEDSFPVTRAHHETLTSFKRSVQQACYVCNHIWSSLHPHQQDFLVDACEKEHDISKSRDQQNISLLDLELAGELPDAPACVINFLLSQSRYDGHELVFIIPSQNIIGAELVRMELFLLTDGNALLFLSNGLHTDIFLASIITASFKLGSSTKSDESFSQAEDWISKCEKSHISCKSALAGVWYLTRLVDCGSLADPEFCRVIECENS